MEYKSWIPRIGDKVIVAHDLDDLSSIREYTVTKVGKDTIQCGSSEMTFYTAFCWPARVRDELTEIVKERARLKKQYDDSMTLIYKLKNAIIRGEK